MIDRIDHRIIVVLIVVVAIAAGGSGAFGYNPAPAQTPAQPFSIYGGLEIAWQTNASSFVVTEYTGFGTTPETLFLSDSA